MVTGAIGLWGGAIGIVLAEVVLAPRKQCVLAVWARFYSWEQHPASSASGTRTARIFRLYLGYSILGISTLRAVLGAADGGSIRVDDLPLRVLELLN